jgi:D-alanyl-lipoteichoic acid acyltransferase DltB (MBOAT superfamily)
MFDKLFLSFSEDETHLFHTKYLIQFVQMEKSNFHCSTIILYVVVDYCTFASINCVIIVKAKTLARKRYACSPLRVNLGMTF